MRRKLILSLDYEIFGNGSGDVRRHMTEPTERLARICESRQVPLTVFAEMEEITAFDRYRQPLRRQIGYDPAKVVRSQLRKLAGRGHDVQLHLHPEWFGATYGQGRWQLDATKATVDALFHEPFETFSYIRERKQQLEELTNRPVVAYRAGAFSAQPGDKLLQACRLTGIQLDSSVVKKLTYHGSHCVFDYSKAPAAKNLWRVRTDVAIEDETGPVWEVPIHSRVQPRITQASWRRLRAKFSAHIPADRRRQMIGQLRGDKAWWQSLPALFAPVPVKLDFHNLAPQTIYRWIKDAPQPGDERPDVLVLIGHSKEHLDDRSFVRLMELLSGDRDLEVIGFTELARLLNAAAVPAQPEEAPANAA